MEDRCEKHGDELFRFFCTDCERLICDVCIDGEHSKHAFCSIRRVAETKRNDLIRQLGSDRQALLDRLHSYSEKVQEFKDNFSIQTEGLIDQVDTKAEYLVDRIHKVREKVVSLVLHYQQQCEEPFTEAQRKIDECLSLISNYSEMLSDTEEKTDREIVSMQTKLDTKLTSVPNPDDIPSGPLMTFENSKEHLSDREIESLFGHFTLNSLSEENCQDSMINKKDAETNTDPVVIRPTSTDENDVQKNVSVEDDLDESCDERNAMEDYATVPIMDEYQDVSLNFELEGQGAVNKILPCYNSKSAYMLTAKSMKFVNALINGSDMSPDKMHKRQAHQTMMSNVSDASMTKDGHVVFIEEKRTYVKKCTSADSVIILAEFPADSTVQCLNVSNDDHIIVCHSKVQERRPRTCITELDEHGVQLKSVTLGMTYRFPYRFCQSVTGDTPLLDLEGPGISRGCVRVVNSDLKHVATYAGAIGPNPSETFEPRGICCDADGCIIVTDCRNHAIHLLDTKGKYKQLILTHKDGIRHPVSVNFDRNGLLWIGCLYGKVHVRKYKDLFL
ncbi:tripartite motif-containing protein 2-like [Pecten maximus]|uniref:tripartite motif-containing protein 2-like n=1 Tax=Pecten maximus TaxID=6579 RepID=UPI0014583E77|nr:tripartite motif-containing protein 2-like [Pecten maximus]